MPKQILKLDEFHGGLNNNTDPRNIMEKQQSLSQNIMVDNLGKIRVIGQQVTSHEANTSTPDVTVEAGYGLFYFNHDRTGGHIDTDDLSGTATSTDSSGGDVLTDTNASWVTNALKGATITNVTDGSSGTIESNTQNTITTTLSGGSDNSFDSSDAYTITNFPTTGARYIALGQSSSAAQVFIYSKQANGSGWGSTAVLDLGSTAGMKPVYYFVDGALRVYDASYNNDSKWFGYVKTSVKSLTALDSVTEQDESIMNVDTWVYGDTALLAPVRDTSNSDPDANKFYHGTQNAAPSSNAGSFTINTRFFANGHYGTGFDGNWNILDDGDDLSDYDIDEKYYVYVSYVYQNGQESALTRGRDIYDNEQNAPWDDKVLFFDFRISNRGQLVDKRIKGINFYYNNTEQSPSERFLLAEYHLEKGFRVAGESEYKKLYRTGSVAASALRITNVIRYKPIIQTYESRNGYNESENVAAKFKTAVVANNVVYAGNVQQDGENFPDAIFKSPPGRYDVFPESRKIEVITADGDEIVKLEEHADRLLQYKKDNLDIINISQDEFLESSHKHKGVLIPAAVCKTDFGVAWVNRFGCYFYNGEQILNLLEPEGFKVISTDEWESFTTDNSTITYLPKKRQVMVLKDCTSTSEGELFIYDFPTQSWSFANTTPEGTVITDSVNRTNFAIDFNGDVTFMHGTELFLKWSDTSSTNQTIQYASKDIDFGAAGLKKKIYNVKVTYKGNASSLLLLYAVNGETDIANDLFQFINPDDGNADSSPLADKSSQANMEEWNVAELKPAVSSQANNIYSFRLVASGVVGQTFAIKDITIIYRLKTIK